MPGLVDIAALSERVKIRGVELEVHGVSAKGIAELLGKYPELRMLMSGKTVEGEDLLALGADIVAAIIAAGVGYPGDQEQIEAAARLPVDDQLTILEAIIRLTMPRGLGFFMDRLTGLAGGMGLNAGASPTVPAPK